MSFCIHYYPELNFVLTRIFGAMDDMQLKELVSEGKKETIPLNAINELADCRKLKDVDKLSVRGTMDAAYFEEGQSWATGGKLAILIPDDPLLYGMARVYKAVSDLSRSAVAVTYSLDDALKWLGYDGADKEALIDFIEKAQEEAQLL